MCIHTYHVIIIHIYIYICIYTYHKSQMSRGERPFTLEGFHPSQTRFKTMSIYIYIYIERERETDVYTSNYMYIHIYIYTHMYVYLSPKRPPKRRHAWRGTRSLTNSDTRYVERAKVHVLIATNSYYSYYSY